MPDEREETLEADYQANREVSEYETLSLTGKMSNFEIVLGENEKLLAQLEDIKIRRRNLGLLVKQHDQEQQTLEQMVRFKLSRSDLRFIIFFQIREFKNELSFPIRGLRVTSHSMGNSFHIFKHLPIFFNSKCLGNIYHS